MRPGPTFKVLGVILMIFSFTMLPPVIVNWIFHQKNASPFVVSFVVTLITGFIFWVPTYKTKRELRTKDGFVVVVLIWLALALFGSIPYLFSNGLHLTFTEAFFESMAGFTTTGATVITNLDNLPKSILYYRQQSQFFGGMGIIVLAVAILPLIGVGGMQLYRAEANGPWKENKLTPRITETAKALWLIYIGLTIACLISYKLCGMSWFDSLCYAYATIGTGGFAPHDASIAYFDSYLIYIVCMFFMILSGTSFALHFRALVRLKIYNYWHDPEFKSYIYFIGTLSLIVSLTLIATNYYSDNVKAMIVGFFQVISFGTNTGFTLSSDYAQWPLFIPALLTILGLIGGCAGSTSGGIKVIRTVLIRKQASREMRRIMHPNGVFPIKYGDKVMSESVMNAVWGFVAGYFLVFLAIWLILMAFGVNMISSFSAVAACISNVGPGIGAVSVNYADLPAGAHWFLDAAMLIGRLEVFTVLVLFMPDFWRR